MNRIEKIYYFISKLKYSLFIRSVGNGVCLRLDGRIINGKYVEIDEGVVLGRRWLIAVYPEYSGVDMPVKKENNRVYIGKGVSANRNLTIYCAEGVEIGKNCMLGSNILITDNEHGMDAEGQSYSSQELITKGKVIIGEECWIGEDVCILAGTTIGKRTIIGAGSVVKGKIPDYSIVAGNPAKVIKRWDFEKHVWKKI